MNLVKISEEKCGQDFEVSVFVNYLSLRCGQDLKVKFGRDYEGEVRSRP